jgi:hypothetical protein
MGLYQIEKPLQSKEEVTRLKRWPTEWEKNLCQLYMWQGINKQKIQDLKKLKSQRINNQMINQANELAYFA